MHSILARPMLLFVLLMTFGRPVGAQIETKLEDLKPIASGPGIQVCEPIGPGDDAALSDFGAGCGLWLQWTMGFHPQLGQTPRWELANRACRELRVSRLRLSLAQGKRLYNILGVTHVAIGRITKTATKCLLTYQLYTVPAQKAVGVPITLSGTEAQIIAELPMAARTLLTGLGVQKRHLPNSVGATPADLTVVGHYGWYEDQKPTDAEQQQIDVLGKKLPVATLLSFVHHGSATARNDEEGGRLLLEQASGNFLMLGAAATFITHPSEAFAQALDRQLATLGAPANAVMAYWAATKARTAEEMFPAIQRIVRLAPHSSTGWLILAHQYEKSENALRSARKNTRLTEEEKDILFEISTRWMQAAARATALDSDYQDAWYQLATAATYADEPERAAGAFWKAFNLDKNDVRVYSLGLRIFRQPVVGDPESLTKIARLSRNAAFPPSADLYGLGLELRKSGFPEEAKTILAEAIVHLRKSVHQYPNDGNLHAVLGAVLHDQSQDVEAETELKTALSLGPEQAETHFQLGEIYRTQQRLADAVVQLRASVRLVNRPEVKDALAESLALMGALDEAEMLLREVLQVAPNVYQPNEDLGWVLSKKKEYDAALIAYHEAARLRPDASLPHRIMGGIYRRQLKFAEAVQEGELAIHLAPQDPSNLTALAATYAEKGETDASVRLYRQATELDPRDSRIHLELGKLLLKMGKKPEARTEWKRVLDLNPPAETAKAAQELLDKNP